jgi:hypothetical protein
MYFDENKIIKKKNQLSNNNIKNNTLFSFLHEIQHLKIKIDRKIVINK